MDSSSPRINFRPRPGALSQRERQALAMLAEGLTRETIARRLQCTESAARNIVNNVYGKLAAVNAAHAVAIAFGLGLLGTETTAARVVRVQPGDVLVITEGAS